MMTEEGSILTGDGSKRPAALERPESGDARIVRVSARFFALAADEKLTPYESAVAWQRIGRMVLREALYKVAMGAFLRTLMGEIATELPVPLGGLNALTPEPFPTSTEGRDA